MKCDYCNNQSLYQCSHALMCEKHKNEHFKIYDKCKKSEFIGIEYDVFYDSNGIKHIKKVI